LPGRELDVQAADWPRSLALRSRTGCRRLHAGHRDGRRALQADPLLTQRRRRREAASPAASFISDRLFWRRMAPPGHRSDLSRQAHLEVTLHRAVYFSEGQIYSGLMAYIVRNRTLKHTNRVHPV